jgi:DNA-binding NtrC family response regulator
MRDVLRAPALEQSLEVDRGAVLLVEDDDEVAPLVAEMLSLLGYRALRADSAAAALRALEEYGPVDVVFSDIIMPGNMNGVQLALEIQRRQPLLPIVLTSGNVQAFERDAQAAGLLLLGKPYGMQELGAAIAHALRRRS